MARPKFTRGKGVIKFETDSISGHHLGIIMTDVVLYGTRFCPFCTAARRLLTARGINFQDVPLENNPELRASVMARSSRNTVPQIWIGDRHVGGYTELLTLEDDGELDGLVNPGVELG